ncbi:AAA family ATPase [Streptomyces acidiscabies]|uniref:AAA family ATPase n=1 Tax=Streptomyces acidiscabies TaxID=42234 RepID=UPI000B02048B|nr:AAA family ATPase [Streptomyces acidiscabies]
MGSHTDELARWGRPARMDRTDARLLGRERELERLDGLLGDPDGPCLVLVRGEHGVGRSAFLRAAGERLRARGGAVYAVDCVPGDADLPLLLALRVVMAVRGRGPVAEALRAVDRGDQTGMEALLRADLARCAPVTVLVDDVQYADTGSLAALGRVDVPGVRLVVSEVCLDGAGLVAPEVGRDGEGLVASATCLDGAVPGVRLVASGASRDGAVPGVRLVASGASRDGAVPGVWLMASAASWDGARPDTSAPADGNAPLLDGPSADVMVLHPLSPHDTHALVARWLQAEADTQLSRQIGELTRGLPGAVEALLTAWTRRDVIRVADGHAFVPSRATVPVLPDDDRFLTALDRLGEPARTVAAALSILGPLGEQALQLTAECTGLSIEAVHEGARRLTEAGIVDEAPGRPFRLPLTAHSVRERMSPVRRSRLSAVAVEVLWNDGGSEPGETSAHREDAGPGPVDGADALASRVEPGLCDGTDASARRVDPESGPGDTPAPRMEPGSRDGTDTSAHRVDLEPGTSAHRAGVEPGLVGGAGASVSRVEPGLCDGTGASAHGVDLEPGTPTHHADVEPGLVEGTGTLAHRAGAGPGLVGGADTLASRVESGLRDGTDTLAHRAEPGRLDPTDTPAHHANAGPLLDGTDVQTYRADRLADAGSLVDRERAVAELTDAARQIRPGADDGRVLRWLRAARDLTEHADARDLVLQQYGITAYLACDYPAARTAAESLLRDPGPTLSDLDLQEAACLIVAVTANQRDWSAMSRLGTAHWWDVLPIPALAKVTGRALALCHLSRWRQTEDLLRTTETVWNTDPRARAVPVVCLATAELGLGRPEPYRRALAFDDAPQLPPGKVYSLAGGMVDNLLSRYDLVGTTALLTTTGLTVPVLPPLTRFLHDHLTGRWDQALESARRLLAGREIQSTPVADSTLLPARTAAILLAQGRVTTALHLVRDAHGPEGTPPHGALHASEAELLMALGDLDRAERTLRTGLDRAGVHDQVHGTDELWSLLAQLTSQAGRDREAADCLRRLEHLVQQTGTDRTRLLYLLTSARVLRDEATAHRGLREAVDLARHRGLPFETATTLVTVATAGAVPVTVLHEAYEVFGWTGASLWRFHTRTALREAGLAVPGRRQATTENDHLLTTLLTEQLTTRQIARVLHLTENAASRRLSRLFARTGTRSRTELVTASLTPTFA